MASKWGRGQVTDVLKKANVSLDMCYRVNQNKFLCAFCNQQDFKFVNEHSVSNHLRYCSQFHQNAEENTISSKINQFKSSRKLVIENQDDLRYKEDVFNFENNTRIFIDAINQSAIIGDKPIYNPLYPCQFSLKQLTIHTPVSQVEKRQLSLSPENSNNTNFKRSTSQINVQNSLIDNIIAIQANVNQANKTESWEGRFLYLFVFIILY